MRAKLVIPKDWKRVKVGARIEKGDRIFCEIGEWLTWNLVLVYHTLARGFDHYGWVMAGEKQTVIRRVK